jgi:DNA-binding NarL/FixJ family response regulator
MTIRLPVRQLEALSLLAEGHSIKSAARVMGIVPHTTKLHLMAIRGKLEARTNAQAVAIAMREGLIQ